MKHALIKIKDKFGEINSSIRDHRQNKYISYSTALQNWYKNRDIKYEMYNLESVKKFITSDTIFIVGAGPSLNLLEEKHIQTISKHDSFGVNYSFLKEGLVTTFQLLSYERNKWAQQSFIDRLAPRRKLYQNTVFFFGSKALFRLGHPRTTPYFFPENPKCCFFYVTKPICLEKDRPFCDEDFDKTATYRGTGTVVLDLVLKLNYKNIVLLGIDPDTTTYFFSEMEEMKEYCVRLQNTFKEQGLTQYPSMHPKANKYHPIDVYYYALRDYLERKRGVQLFTGFKSNMLYPKLPAYFE